MSHRFVITASSRRSFDVNAVIDLISATDYKPAHARVSPGEAVLAPEFWRPLFPETDIKKGRTPRCLNK